MIEYIDNLTVQELEDILFEAFWEGILVGRASHVLCEKSGIESSEYNK